MDDGQWNEKPGQGGSSLPARMDGLELSVSFLVPSKSVAPDSSDQGVGSKRVKCVRDTGEGLGYPMERLEALVRGARSRPSLLDLLVLRVKGKRAG